MDYISMIFWQKERHAFKKNLEELAFLIEDII